MRMIYFMDCPLFRYHCESQGLFFISLIPDKALNSCNQFQVFCELSSLTGCQKAYSRSDLMSQYAVQTLYQNKTAIK